MSEMVQCKFNRNHKIKLCKVKLHEARCPDRTCSEIAVCPYNNLHKVNALFIERHKLLCPDQLGLPEGLYEEMKDYIQKTFKKNKPEEEAVSDDESHMNLINLSADDLFQVDH